MRVQGHIFLVGFMGSGKSTVGPMVAAALGLPFRDLDSLIEARHQRTILEIFHLRGEPHFRRLERDHLREVIRGPRAVIALGGGTFVGDNNRKLVQSSGVSIWLRLSCDLAWQRSAGETRPLARDEERFRELFLRREPVYACADLAVDVQTRPPEEIATEINRLIKELRDALD